MTPDLDEQFLEPEGWRWHHFERETPGGGRRLRFGSVFPKDKIPDAIVVCLPGLSEFGEKYFETARRCLDMNFAFWVIDWVGQGKSSRYLKNPQKRHGADFQHDVDDLHEWILNYIKHSSVHPDKGRIPLAMMAHSMGGNIGLRYLQQHPEVFECAAFSAPMFGIQAVNAFPKALMNAASSALNKVLGKRYVSGFGDWVEAMRPTSGPLALSNDPVRVGLQNKWFKADPELQIGNVTYGWVYHAMRSCAYVIDDSFLESIKTPCLIATADQDHLVDNDAVRFVANTLPHAKLIELKNARHEILMETDALRDAFFKAFYTLVKENIIDRPETLKPF